MIHHASADFWKCFHSLPTQARDGAERAFALLKADPKHPSLHFKKIDRLWSARIGLHYRALGVDASDGLLWFWIGSHADYDTLVG